MDDLDRYARERAGREPAFAEGLERESAAFRVGVGLQRAREDAGLTRQQVAQRVGVKLPAVGRMETNAGEVRLSTLQAYAEAVGHRLVLEVRAAQGRGERTAPGGDPRAAGSAAGERRAQMRSLAGAGGVSAAEWP